MSEPKKWKLYEHGCGDPTYVQGPEIDEGTTVEVVVLSAYHELQQKLTLAIGALKLAAFTIPSSDGALLAREALLKIEGENEQRS